MGTSHKYSLLIWSATLLSGAVQAVEPATNGGSGANTPPSQFMSTVQVAVQEPSSELVQRSQRLVREQFVNVFATWPEFRGRSYEVRTQGNEVTLSLVTGEDIRPSMQQAVANIIEHLNGRVQARGRSLFYRTSLSPESAGYLEVKVEEDAKTKTKRIRSISAQSVPLRDLLKEIRFQMGALSYLIPGECAERLVDWNFGTDGQPSEAKDIDTLMKLLARSFGIGYENVNGTFVFTGNCADVRPRQKPKNAPPSEMFRGTNLVPSGYRAVTSPQVYFPLMPLE